MLHGTLDGIQTVQSLVTSKQNVLRSQIKFSRAQQKGVDSINILYKRQFTEQKWINRIERADFLRVRTLKRRMGDTF